MKPRRHAVLLATIAVCAGALQSTPASAAPPWSPVTTLSSDITTSDVAVAADAAGDAAALWAESTGVMAATRPPGGSWSAPQHIGGSGAADRDVSIAADGTGTFTAAWIDSGVVEVATGSLGSGWGPPVPVPSGDASGVRLAVAPSGRAVLVWLELSNVFVAVRASSASGWSGLTALSGAAYVNSADVGIDDAGVAVASWSSGGLPSADDAIEVSLLPVGGLWSHPVTVSDGTYPVTAPELDVNAGGAATLAWTESRGFNSVVVVATPAGDGTWTAPEDLSDPLENGYDPGVAMGPDGSAVVAWNQEDADLPHTQAVYKPAGGSWGEVADVSDQAQRSTDESVVMADDGTATVAWRRFGDEGQFVQAARVTRVGTWSGPFDVTERDEIHSDPSLAVDGQGDVTAAFEERSGSGSLAAAASLDASAPVIDGFVVPPAGHVHQTLRFSAAASDLWSSVASYAWRFGDGATATGPAPTHAYVAAGSYPVSLTVTDSAGNTTRRTATTTVTAAGAAPSPPGSRQPPTITLFKVKHATIRALSRGAGVPPPRTKLKIRLTSAAEVRLVLRSKHRHLLDGRRTHVHVTLTRRLPAGRSSVALKGRLATIRLLPDTYRIVGVATNPAGISPARRARLVVADASSRMGDAS